MKHKVESRLPAEISNLRYADDTTFMAESKELKGLLMKVKEESEKAGLKLNIRKMKIMASRSIISWQIYAKNGEIVSDFILRGFKINEDETAATKFKDACSLEA